MTSGFGKVGGIEDFLNGRDQGFSPRRILAGISTTLFGADVNIAVLSLCRQLVFSLAENSIHNAHIPGSGLDLNHIGQGDEQGNGQPLFAESRHGDGQGDG
jgi:hypothetical protein